MEIYLITNLINNKQYVGQTVYTKEKRWYGHLRGTLCVDRAIQKYGAENFKLETLEEVKSEDDLDQREQYWIAELDTMVPSGYNITPGGNCHVGKSVNYDVEKIFYRKYYPSTNLRTNKRIKMYIINREDLNNYVNNKGCNEDINSSADTWVEWYRNPLKFVKKYIDEDDLESLAHEIHYYPSVHFLQHNLPEQCYGFLTTHNINKALDGVQLINFDWDDVDLHSDYLGYVTYRVNDLEYDEYVKRVLGEKVEYYNQHAKELEDFLHWERKIKILRHQESIKKSIEKNKQINSKNANKVKQYMQDGEYLIEYGSYKDASLATGISETCIVNSCKGRTVVSGGFLWCESGNEQLIDRKIKILQKRKRDKEKNKKRYESQYKYKKRNQNNSSKQQNNKQGKKRPMRRKI
jgi:hypothetical protein